MNKLFLLSALIFGFSISLFAQETIGIEYYQTGDFDLAEQYLEANQNSANSCFYLGDIALSRGKKEEANALFNKGLAIDANNPYCKIGLAKAKLKENKASAMAELLTIEKKFNYDAKVLVAIGYAYFANGMNEETNAILAIAKKANKKEAAVYVLEGDILKAQNKLGDAAGKYEIAIYFDENYAPAYIKWADLYRYTNVQATTAKLKELLKLQPNDMVAERYLAQIYTANGYYPMAIEAFAKFFTAGHYTSEDIVRYVSALFFNQQYDEAKTMLIKGLSLDPKNFVLHRLQMYIAANQHNTEEGLKFGRDFFALGRKDNTYLAKDYENYGNILKDAKMYQEAYAEYEKAIAADTALSTVYKDMASIKNNQKEYGQAGDLYAKYIKNTKKEDIVATDFFQMGRYYYAASSAEMTTDTLKAISYINQAMSAFDTVIIRIPDGYTGYLWRARAASLLDSESELGLAKPFYEKTIEIVSEKEDKNKTMTDAIIEGYTYLGYYYYIKEENENTILYWNKVLELDPNNTNAHAVLNDLSKKKKK